MKSEIKTLEYLNLLYRGTAKSLDEKQSAYLKIVFALMRLEELENKENNDETQ